MIPVWIPDEAWRPINPPAEVRALGDQPRTPEKYLQALRSLHVTIARRYQPDASGTKCNIFVGDGCVILDAPLPHRFDLGDGRGEREMQANDIVDGLRAGKFPGWSKIGSWASRHAAMSLAAEGKPTIVTWRNWEQKRTTAGQLLTLNGRPLYRSGHVGFVVPAPPIAGLTGVWVTAAGTHCVEGCPIELSFGVHVPEVEFWAHD